MSNRTKKDIFVKQLLMLLIGLISVVIIEIHADAAGSLAAPKVEGTFANTSTILKWSTVKGATGYKIYRKTNSRWRCIKTTNKTSYTEKYTKLDRSTKKRCRIIKNKYIDPSYNDLVYAVRAYKKNNSGMVYSKYREEFNLEQPTIISYTKGTLTWGTVPNAEKYRVYVKKNGHWIKYKTVKARQKIKQKTKISKSGTQYTVRAVAVKNGKTILSKYDQHFCIDNKKYGSNHVLVVGDSLLRGVPYVRSDDLNVFSIPYRIQELTGAVIQNKAVSRACIHYHSITSTYKRKCLLTDVIEKTDLTQYDVIILEGGTNDYASSAKLGGLESRDITTFCGGLNTIIDDIEKASSIRIARGRKPVKVVLLDIPFRNRCGKKMLKKDADNTPNSRGLTLLDYQAALNTIWQDRSQTTNSYLYHYKTRSYNIVTNNNSDQWLADNLHMTKKAYAEYGNSMVEFMIDHAVIE